MFLKTDKQTTLRLKFLACLIVCAFLIELVLFRTGIYENQFDTYFGAWSLVSILVSAVAVRRMGFSLLRVAGLFPPALFASILLNPLIWGADRGEVLPHRFIGLASLFCIEDATEKTCRTSAIWLFRRDDPSLLYERQIIASRGSTPLESRFLSWRTGLAMGFRLEPSLSMEEGAPNLSSCCTSKYESMVLALRTGPAALAEIAARGIVLNLVFLFLTFLLYRTSDWTIETYQWSFMYKHSMEFALAADAGKSLKKMLKGEE